MKSLWVAQSYAIMFPMIMARRWVGRTFSVNSSNGVEVYGNNVRASGVAGSILMQAANRADQLVTANNYFHNNVVTITSNSSRFGFANFGGSVGTG